MAARCAQAMSAWRQLPRAERRRRLRALLWGAPEERQTLVRSGLQALGEQLALQWLRQRMEEDAEAQCGAPKGKHDRRRRGRRHAWVEGSVVLGGRRVPILRPRVRSLQGHELPIPTDELAQDERLLSEAMLARCLAGAAQRRYADTVEEPPAELPAGSVSRSTVSRRCQQQMTELARQFCTRPLGGQRWLAVFLDGIQLGEHHVIVALGVAEDGQKQVLGLWEGGTESEAVCRAALEDLVARGLTAERGLLVVIDGGKGLYAAVRAVWGSRALVQRCQAHKLRNLQEHLPRQAAERVTQRVHRAWAQGDAAQGERALRALADALEGQGYGEAARSLREGLTETFTCVRLGLPPELCRVLETTNPLESGFSQHQALAWRVKRWRDGRQALRWVATALALAEESFAPLASAADLAVLAQALDRHVAGLTPLAVGA
jgi:transposase-like protein